MSILLGFASPWLSFSYSLSSSTTRIEGSEAEDGVAQGSICFICFPFWSLLALPSPGELGAEVAAIDRLRTDNDDELSIEDAIVSIDGLRREDVELFEKSVEESEVIDPWIDKVSVWSGMVEFEQMWRSCGCLLHTAKKVSLYISHISSD